VRTIATLAAIGILATCVVFPAPAESDTHSLYTPPFDVCQVIYRGYSGPLSYVDFVYPCVTANRIRV
jgi:hypothetical protein